jgi:endoglucanase
VIEAPPPARLDGKMLNTTRFARLNILLVATLLQFTACEASHRVTSEDPMGSRVLASESDAWAAVGSMNPGINIGNTLENTKEWETGWGNPPITREYVQNLAKLGFKTVRLPVAWDTYAVNGQIQPDKFKRVEEVIDWITDAGMFCVINIHWDGGWIDSDVKEKYSKTYHTFSPDAERKFRSYWEQIARRFADKGPRVIFEALNEETSFANDEDPYDTLRRVNQLFIDTVRESGGNNARRLLIVTGYSTDIQKTCAGEYKLPTDVVPHKLFISVHYYTPYQFCGLNEDATWGKMRPTWGTSDDYAELNRLFDMMAEFCKRNDMPAFIGELGVTSTKESASRVRWMSAVFDAARSRNMIPVLWDTGGEISRREPFTPTDDLLRALQRR